MSDSLADALPREIARVSAKRDRWIEMRVEFPELRGLEMTIAIMQAEINRGVAALASGDIVEMLQAQQALKDYEDD